MSIRRFSSILYFFVSLLVTTLVHCSASAQSGLNGFAVNRFNPSERGSEWFFLDSLDMRGKKYPTVGVVLDWAHNPLFFEHFRPEVTRPLINHQFFAHVGASFVIAKRVRLGMNLPIALAQGGTDQFYWEYWLEAPDAPAIGDFRVAADVRLFGQHGDEITGAIGCAAFFPTGQPKQYTSDGTFRLAPRASMAGDISWFTYAFSFGFMMRSKANFANYAMGPEVTWGASTGVRLLERKLVIGPELSGMALVSPDPLLFEPPPNFEVLLGARYTVRWLRFGLGASTRVTRALGSPPVRLLFSAEWVPEMTDGKKNNP